MFQEITKEQITAEEIKNRLLAYTSLQAAREVVDDHAWYGNIETYTLNLRLSGAINEKQFNDVLTVGADSKPNTGKYAYLPNQIFLNETVSLNHHSFVQEMYRAFLRREADSGGLAGNVEQLNNGAPRENLVIGIRRSGEADNVFLRITTCLDDRTFLDIAYDIYLDPQFHQEKRTEDLPALSQGISRQEVFGSIKQFQELKIVLQNLAGDYYQEDRDFLTHTQSLDIEQFVEKLYRVFLKREADSGGLASHSEQLHNGIARQEILQALRTSAEAAGIFVNLTSGLDNNTFIEVAYRAYIKSSIDAITKKNHLETLERGTSRHELLISL
jgi:hypothetical protein